MSHDLKTGEATEGYTGKDADRAPPPRSGWVGGGSTEVALLAGVLLARCTQCSRRSPGDP